MKYTVILFMPIIWQGEAGSEDEATENAMRHFEADEKYKDDNVLMVKVIKHNQ
jgi:hypothetical protein